jgi:exonuclease III
LSNRTSKQGTSKTKQQRNKNDWQQKAPLNTNTECKWLNAPVKRHRLANWTKKQDPIICCLQETHRTEKNKHWLRIKGWKKVFQVNGPHKQAGVTILISEEVDFKLKSIRRDNEGHFILMKGTIH